MPVTLSPLSSLSPPPDLCCHPSSYCDTLPVTPSTPLLHLPPLFFFLPNSSSYFHSIWFFLLLYSAILLLSIQLEKLPSNGEHFLGAAAFLIRGVLRSHPEPTQKPSRTHPEPTQKPPRTHPEPTRNPTTVFGPQLIVGAG